jgi:hypothetical protein
MANEPDKLADDGLEELAAQRLRVLAAHDAYVLSLIDIQAKWLAYIKQHSFIGLQIQKLILKLEGALPPRLFDLASQHSKALATIANDVNKALGAVVNRVDTAYTVAIWTDRAITVIEALTAVGGGAHLAFKAAIKHGFARNVALRMAIKYGIKQLAVQAAAYVAAGYTLPPLIAAAGLNQDFVFTGLMVVQGLGALHAVRSARVVGPPPSNPKLDIIDDYFEPHPGRIRENIRGADDVTQDTIGKQIEAEMEIPLLDQRGVWDEMGPGMRGFFMEARRGPLLPAGFRTFDKFNFEEGIATSIKSLDIWAKTYSDPKAIIRQCKNYIDAIRNYKSTTRGEITIIPQQIRERRLDVIIPPYSTPRQRDAFTEVIAYGRESNVIVSFIEISK